MSWMIVNRLIERGGYNQCLDDPDKNSLFSVPVVANPLGSQEHVFPGTAKEFNDNSAAHIRNVITKYGGWANSNLSSFILA
jgi:hypothetical protein